MALDIARLRPNMKILVTFAVQAEFAPWRRIRNFRPISETEFVTRSGDAAVHVLITGIRAPKFHLPAADICLASGVAGSLNLKYAIGSVLVAKTVKRKLSESILRTDEFLVRSAMRCGATPADCFCTTDNIVSTTSEKSRLGRIADAVDMETYPILSEAHRLGIPAVAIRAISDTADQELPFDFSRAINQKGKLEWLPALSQFAVSPRRLPQLMRFGIESFRAARKLTEFLDKYLECLTAGADSLARGMENRGA